MATIRSRRITRRTISKTQNELEQTLQMQNPDETQINSYIFMMEKELEELYKQDKEIQNALSDEELEDEFDECWNRRAAARNIIEKAKQYLKSKSSQEQIQNRKQNSNDHVRLPKLNLNKFDGDATKWQSFWDLFEQRIHNERSLSGAEKLSYLIGLLEKNALKTVEGFQITDSNYLEAIDILKEQYGQRGAIINRHLDILFDLKFEHSNAEGLENFRSTYENHLRGLKAMNLNIDDSGWIFAALLMRKLPNYVKENIKREHNKDEWTLDEFRKLITKEINLGISKPRTNYNTQSSRTSHPPPTVGSFGITKDNTPHCQFCEESHFSNDCKKFKTTQERKERAKNLNLCFNCLRNNHKISDCQSKKKCRTCCQTHHTSLCDKKNVNHSNVSYSIRSNEKQGIALPTALIPIKNRRIRSFFDLGAQESLILKSTVEDLSLKIIGHKQLKIDGYESRGKMKLYKVAEIPISSQVVSRIEALVVESLPTKISMNGINDLQNELMNQGIELADPTIENDCAENIQILVGADYYNEFVTDIFSKWNTVVLYHSPFGKMISGPIPYIKPRNQESEERILNCFILEEDISKLWDMDTIGIKEEDMKRETKHEICSKLFEDSINYNQGKYSVQLPWKEDSKEKLPTNFNIAKNILNSTIKRLKKEPKMIQIYDSILKDYENKGFIEEIDTIPKTKGTHFLSHHGVKRDSTTTP